jgi:hypothetical protein
MFLIVLSSLKRLALPVRSMNTLPGTINSPLPHKSCNLLLTLEGFGSFPPIKTERLTAGSFCIDELNERFLMLMQEAI